MRLNPLSLMGGAYADNSLTWSAQRTLNWLPETAEVEGTRTPIKFADPPGLRSVVDLGTNAPIRGIENVEGTLFVVSGTTLFEIASDYTATNRGNIPGVGRVSMAHNKQGGTTAANQLAIANGLSGYVYNTSTNVLSQITDESFEGASTVDYIDGFITFTDPQGRFWGHSALNQAGEYSTIDRYDAESAPDPIVSHIASHREAIVFGTRTTEFFRNTGAATNTFQRVDGTELEVGICSTFARARVDNSVCWVSDSLEVFRLEGHSPQRISTRPIEQLLHTVNPANIFAFSWEDRGHKVFYITAPEAFTLGFDFASGMWHERQTFDLPRWRVNALASWNNRWIAGDYTNGLLYELDWDTHHENGLELIRERASGYTHGGQNKVLAPYVELLFDTGVQDQQAEDALTITGDLPDAEVGVAIPAFSYSAAGGFPPYTFSIISGALPDGLSMSGLGAVTGTPTVGGSYSWTVRVTDASGDFADLEDTALVSTQTWWLTTSNGPNVAKLWQSTSLASFGAGANRTPNTVTATFGPIMVDTGVALIAGDGSGMERITDFDPVGGHATTSVSLPATLTSAGRVRAFGEVVVALPQSGTSYYTSGDRGLTWTTRSVSSGFIVDVARLSTGRWIATLSDGGDSAFLYSDQAGEPTTWLTASSAGVHISAKGVPICCNGTVAAAVGNSFGSARTTSGSTWTAVTSPVGALGASAYDAIAAGNTFLTVENGGGAYFRSTDAGQSWTRHTGETEISRFSSIGSIIVASKTVVSSGMTGARFTVDGGASWSDVTMPYLTAPSDVIRVISVRYVP